METVISCPCNPLRAYAQCCGVYHDGLQRASTAEALMRSRYSAFALSKVDYLLRTHLGHEKDATLRRELSVQKMQWVSLEIHETKSGESADTHGEVFFTAHYLDPQGRLQGMSERSAFVKKSGAWYYVGFAKPKS